jgi:ABC-type uncharacterized transport system permease subunit
MFSLITLRKQKLIKILKNKYQHMYIIKLTINIFSVNSFEFLYYIHFDNPVKLWICSSPLKCVEKTSRALKKAVKRSYTDERRYYMYNDFLDKMAEKS